LYFKQKHQAKNIGKKSLYAYLITAGINLLKFCINIASVAVLARLLRPEDFGYVAMAATFIAMPKVVLGQHLSTGVVQSKTLGHSQLNSFFWLSMAITLIVWVLSVFCAPIVAWFYTEANLTSITRIMALMILFSGLSAIHLSLLSRTMQFGILSGVDLAAKALSKVVAVILALWGGGYWALVAMPVSYEGIKMVLIWWFCRFRPGRFDHFDMGLVKVGTVWSGNAIFRSFVSELDKIVIGKFLGSSALGFYTRGFNLGEMPGKFIAWPLNSIAVSGLSRLQDDVVKFKRYFLLLSELFLFVFTPVLMVLYLSSESIVLLVLGDKWVNAIPVFQGLLPFFLAKNLMRPIGWFQTSTFHSGKRVNKIAYLALINNSAIVLGIAVGVWWGIVGIAITMSLFSLVSFLICALIVFNGEIIEALDYFKSFWKSTLSACVVICIFNLQYFRFDGGHIKIILLNGLISSLIYLLVFLCLPNGKKALFDAMITVNKMLNRKSNTAAR